MKGKLSNYWRYKNTTCSFYPIASSETQHYRHSNQEKAATFSAVFTTVSFQPALSIFRPDDPAEALSTLGPAFIVTSREDELAQERTKMKRGRNPSIAQKAKGALYYKKTDLHYCQKQTAKCPITPILTPKFDFPASDLAKERIVQ